MKPEEILAHKGLVLTEAQRAAYFSDGFLVLPDYVPAPWLDRLRSAMNELMDRSRRVMQSNDIFVLEEGHGPDNPRLHRVTSPQDQHPVFWEFMCDPVMTDLAADVVGPDVKFHHAKLNVKSERGTRGFKWHQDIPAWPHTDYSPVTIGIYLNGCDQTQGPLSFVRGSHLGPLHSQYDETGAFVVRVREDVVRAIPRESIVTGTGGPGTTILLNCRTIHGSEENRSDRARPLLLPVYSSADSFAYTPSPINSPHLGDIVRGAPARFASFDLRPCELPPDFRGGYTPPWTAQKKQEQRSISSLAM
ncbi:MAG TPA: phytanoyl-CoA dioxygenase family protein [Rhodopila sp.]|nr:phytanoyl-CoA dioxygenase family protein [Rhodopila sp.]